jgi:hypothetical protein
LFTATGIEITDILPHFNAGLFLTTSSTSLRPTLPMVPLCSLPRRISGGRGKRAIGGGSDRRDCDTSRGFAGD